MPESEGSLTTHNGEPRMRTEEERRDVKFQESFFIKTRRFFIFNNLPQIQITKNADEQYIQIQFSPQTAPKWCLKVKLD